MSRLVAAAGWAAGLLSLHAAANARLLRRPPHVAAVHERVSVLVPARNEAARIGPCVRAVLDQRSIDLELLVLDDASTDSTAEVVRTVAAEHARAIATAPRSKRVIEGAALPEGWLGKPHACQQLAEAASGTVLAFLDADVVLAPDGLARSVALLRQAGLHLVSPYPRQETVSVAERLVQPLLQWSWLTFLPLRLAEWSSAPSLTAANGQLLVCDAEAYRRAGGHAAVRAEVVEDVALARAFKRAGLRATVADGTDVATCRMYEGWSEIRDGYGKSLWAAFGSPAGAVAAMALLTWLYLVPPLTAVARSLSKPGTTPGAEAPGRHTAPIAGPGLRRAGSDATASQRAVLVPAVGYAAGVTGRAITAWRTGGRPLDALAHPLSVAALAYLTARSWWLKVAGGLTWRGRQIP